MNNESFVMYESVYKQAQILEKRLGKETAYNFLNAVMEFGLFGVIPEEDSEVWLYGFEQTITSISKAKSRYEAAVENGKKGGRKPTVDREKVIALKATGMTNKQVAAELGCSESTIEKINKENRKNQKNLNDNVNENDNNNNLELRQQAADNSSGDFPEVEKEITLEQVEALLEKGSYYIENNVVYCNDKRIFKLI